MFFLSSHLPLFSLFGVQCFIVFSSFSYDRLASVKVKVSPFVFVGGCGVREESLLNVRGTWMRLLFSCKLCYLWGLFVCVVQRVVLCICVVVVCG